MAAKRENKPRQPRKQTTKTSSVRRDSLTRTKAVLNAALRVWELKRRSPI